MARWYIIHAYSGFENKVRDSILSEAERMGLSQLVEAVEVPTETVTEVKRGKKVQVERKFMPGYVLAKLALNDDVVMTELAYEKANKLGLKLVRAVDNPPSAPVRPYLTGAAAGLKPIAPVVDGDLHARVREAVTARLGKQVDPALLDTIIARSLKAVGLK